MKIKTLLLTFVLAVLFGTVLPPQAEARVTFSYFYESLQPYGGWVDVDSYGYCWQPWGLDRDWRPYTDGYWSYTDAGWTWVSYEDFGSITYHYGRWICLEDYGWVWKPDYEWGPAWVSWRKSDDYIGWAPLPPDAVFEPQTGIGVWVDRDYDIGPSAYSFCEYRYFGAPVMRNVLIPRRRNVAIINSTVNITNITVVTGNGQGRMVFNGGLNYAQVAARSQNRIEALQLVRQTDGEWAQHHRAELSRRVGGQLFVNAPEVEAPATRFAPAAVTQQIHAPKIDKGWSGVSNAAEREQITQSYHAQTQGMTRATAPAKAVDSAQVQTMMNQARTHQKQGQQPAQVQPMQIPQSTPVQQQVQTQQQPPGQKENPRHKEQQPTPAQLPMQVQQSTPVPQQSPAQKENPRHKEQIPQPVQQPTPAHQSVQPMQMQPQVQVTQPLEQPKVQQEQQRKAAEAQAEQRQAAAQAQARAAREQEQAQRAQQAQAQAEQQRQAAAQTQARAAREQEQAQRAQKAQAQAEQQRQAAAQAQHAQQAQAPAQGSPSPDDRKKHKDNN